MEVDMDHVKISLYDNGEVDDDSISVFLNGKLIATHQRLSTRPIQLTIPLDSLLDYVELSMFAENLGSIPPNTALMIVEAGDRQYQIRLTSTLEKSASVRIKRKRIGLKVR
jgi:archaellum component FlaF (FlaF/FlaG flagellin family)